MSCEQLVDLKSPFMVYSKKYAYSFLCPWIYEEMSK